MYFESSHRRRRVWPLVFYYYWTFWLFIPYPHLTSWGFHVWGYTHNVTTGQSSLNAPGFGSLKTGRRRGRGRRR
jgi:hypothetical protein